MNGAAITFDSGALIALERRKERAMKVYTHARNRGLVVATPNVTVAEWWRGRTDRREAVLRGLLVEPASDEVVKLAGVALVIVIAGHWMLGQIIGFTHNLFDMIPQLLQS